MKRMLLVEPDVVMGKMLVSEAKGRKLSVSWSKTAESAIHAADDKKPDFVLMELQIAKHNGLEFLYEFKSYSEWIDIPVFIYTSLPSVEMAAIFKVSKQLEIRAVYHKSHCGVEQLYDSISKEVSLYATS
jgi:DNA-binding response OmpR family regulator